MGVSQTQRFTAEQNRKAQFAKALGHPARIAILEQLLESKHCICGDLVLALPLSQSTISQHLKELKAAGLIQGNVEGTSVCYCIDPKNWEEARQLFTTFLESYKEERSCC